MIKVARRLTVNRMEWRHTAKIEGGCVCVSYLVFK